MKRIDTENVILGSGPGGYVAGLRLGALKRETVLVEKGEIGGVCLNVGCIPSKALIRLSKMKQSMEKSKSMGLSVQGIELDMKKAQTWKNGVVKRLTGGVKMLLEKRGVKIIRGSGKFRSVSTLFVEGEDDEYEINFRNGIIASGSVPVELSTLPFGGRILDSTGALALEEVPEHLAIVGGGYIGLELAFMYSGLGAKVTVIELMPQVLPGFDKDLADEMLKSLRRRHIRVYLESTVAKLLKNGPDSIAFSLKGKDGKENSIEASFLVVAVGRKPTLEGWGADKTHVLREGDRFIQTDDKCRTRVQGLYAIGDVAGPPMLAHKASVEGEVAAETITGLPASRDGRPVPGVAFTDPEVAVVGLTERMAVEQGVEYRKGLFPVAASGRAMTMGAREGFVKVIVEEGSEKILGAAIMAPEASEMIAEAALAVQIGADLHSLADTIHAHPTMAEAFHEAVLDVSNAAIHK